MNRPLTLRILLVYLPIDVFFSLALCFAHLALFDVDRITPYLSVFAGIWAIRFFGWAALVNRTLSPVGALCSALRDASDAKLRSARRRLDEARARVPSMYAFGWFAQMLLATVYMAWGYPEPEQVSPFALEGSLFLVLAVLIGALVFSYPLIGVLSNPEASALSLAASERGLEQRPTSSLLQRRVAILALGLALAPTLFVASLGYSNAGRQGLDIATRDAERATLAVLAEVQRLSALDEEAGGAALSKQLDHESAAGVVFARDGEPLHGGGALRPLERSPALEAKLREAIQTGADGVITDRRAGVAVALRSIDEERVAAAVVTSSREKANAFLFAAIAFALTVLVWAPLSALLFSRSIALPVAELGQSVRRLVTEGRLSEIGTLPIVGDDEVSALGHDVNEMLTLLRSLSEASRQVAAGRLDVDVGGVGDLPDAFRGMLESLRRMVSQMSDTSLQLGSAATEIFAATQEQEMAATTQSSSMREISQTMVSLSESAAHVAEAVEGVLQNAELTVTMSDRMVARIGELNAHTGRIGELLEVIREIADRSDLLALNGALEASHAGEAGRGFALVASEMRRLAERVTASVKDVRVLVDDIKQSGASTVMATEESRKLANATTDAARKITLVTQQQRSSTEQVSESVRELTDVVSQTVAATAQTRASSETLKDRADQLAQLVHEFSLETEAAE